MKREFDFLPELPKPSLDDRKFADLVTECLLRIPRYCPEWTNHNPSDPGVTLIELFAWLTDQMLLRFNQIPLLNYIGFLELLGIKLQSAKPAKCEVTFYLTTSLPEQYIIPVGTIVATERTEAETAIEFTTDENLLVTPPKIRHLLTGLSPETVNLRDSFNNWRQEEGAEWIGRETNIFDDKPDIGNCFYIVLDNDQIVGNVIVLNIKANAGTPTGINPQNPPRVWEAWTGDKWENILLKESDDNTEGFSFSKFSKEGGDPSQTGADITLHLPLNLPASNFESYEGKWLRCRFIEQEPGYSETPKIMSVAIRAIGGTVKVTQCTPIENESLGESDGNPGQSFQLQYTPILTPEKHIEYIEVTPPGGLPETWEQVDNFAESTEYHRHYTLDEISGKIQFGPLIREPAQIKESTWKRQKLQTNTEVENLENLEKFSKRQYGKIPPRGSTITMVKYRTGGGEIGNVEKGTIKICKSARPYIAKIENHQPAKDGTDPESLEAAMMRVPQQLRTPNRAVTAEDFETLARRGSQGGIARAHCLNDQPGSVRLLLVPEINVAGIEKRLGISPEEFNIKDNLRTKVKDYLEERRLLGIRIIYDQPQYLGISVHSQISLQQQYKNNDSAKMEIEQTLLVALYRFLNPINGYFDQQGWPFGRCVYKSDIYTVLQTIAGVAKVEWIKLYPIIRNHNGTEWRKLSTDQEEIKISALQLICSWNDPTLDSGHKVYLD